MENENKIELIDKKTVLEEFCRFCIVGIEGNCPDGGCAEFRHISRIAPVDAVAVVRCKDCVSGQKQPYSNLVGCNVMGCNGLKETDFCSYGKRRELWTTQAK